MVTREADRVAQREGEYELARIAQVQAADGIDYGDGRTPFLVSLRPALRELERYAAWVTDWCQMDLRERIVVTIQTRGRTARLGHFSPDRWRDKAHEPLHELMVSAEDLQRPTLEVLEIVQHEIVHAFCHEGGIRDTAKSGRHNKLFKEMAEAFELTVSRGTGSQGWAVTAMTEEHARVVLDTFQPDEGAFAIARAVIPPKERKPSRTLPWACDCPIMVRVAAGLELRAVCRICDADFQRKE